MTYQYKREPLTIEEADRLFTVADTLQEKLSVYGLLETGLRVSELARLSKQRIDFQRSIWTRAGPRLVALCPMARIYRTRTGA